MYPVRSSNSISIDFQSGLVVHQVLGNAVYIQNTLYNAQFDFAKSDFYTYIHPYHIYTPKKLYVSLFFLNTILFRGASQKCAAVVLSWKISANGACI